MGKTKEKKYRILMGKLVARNSPGRQKKLDA
jgi:hypothetical protein